MTTPGGVSRLAWIGMPVWFASWFVVMQLLVDWSGGASTAAIAGGIAGVLLCGEQAWRSRTSRG